MSLIQVPFVCISVTKFTLLKSSTSHMLVVSFPNLSHPSGIEGVVILYSMIVRLVSMSVCPPESAATIITGPARLKLLFCASAVRSHCPVQVLAAVLVRITVLPEPQSMPASIVEKFAETNTALLTSAVI